LAGARAAVAVLLPRACTPPSRRRVVERSRRTWVGRHAVIFPTYSPG
jgi:hypothetical protein